VDVLGPHRAGEPVGRVVGDLQRLVLGGERQRRDHRAEHLLPDDGGGGPPAAGEGRALLLGTLEVAEHLLVLRLVGHRPHLGAGVGRVAEPDGAGPRHQPLDQGVVDVGVHDQA
jgi:hypothetical protein